VADVFIVGGAAMALAYDATRVTRDVDAMFKPHRIVHEEAMQVGKDLGLPRWWLNEQASTTSPVKRTRATLSSSRTLAPPSRRACRSLACRATAPPDQRRTGGDRRDGRSAARPALPRDIARRPSLRCPDSKAFQFATKSVCDGGTTTGR
jgi:hypothetical protein